MNQLTFFDKIQVLFKLLFSSPIIIGIFAFSLVLMIILFFSSRLNKRIIKYVFIGLYIIIIGFAIIKYGSYFLTSLDSFVTLFMANIYFPIIPVYIVIMLISFIIMIITLSSKKKSRVVKIINTVFFTLIQMLFAVFIYIVESNDIDLSSNTGLYTNDQTMTLLELGMGLFFIWMIILLVILYLKKADKIFKVKKNVEQEDFDLYINDYNEPKKSDNLSSNKGVNSIPEVSNVNLSSQANNVGKVNLVPEVSVVNSTPQVNNIGINQGVQFNSFSSNMEEEPVIDFDDSFNASNSFSSNVNNSSNPKSKNFDLKSICNMMNDSKKQMVSNKFRSSSVMPKVSKSNVFNKNKDKQYKEYDYYRLFRALRYIIFLFPKKILSKGIFNEVEELIEEYYIRNLDEEWGITEEDIQNLIELRYITEKKINNQKFFTFELFKMKNVENSINFPEEPQYLQYLPEPVTLTCKLLLKMKDVFKDCRYLIENEFATEKDKIKIITSKKIYHTYTCIKLLSKINIERFTRNEKLSIILNLYQIMSFHFIIKQIITDYSKNSNENKKNSLLIELKNLISILSFWHKSSVEITYNISGQIITLYELKHIVLRRNRIPPKRYMKLAGNNDPRINFLDGNWEDFTFEQRLKILCLCFDPVDIFDDKVNEIMQPLGICFNDKTFDKDLNNSFHLFVKENIWIDDNNSKLNIPYFLKEYLYDLDNDENRMINVLLQQLYKTPFLYKEYRKIQCRLLAGKIVVRYYKEYDRPQRIV